MIVEITSESLKDTLSLGETIGKALQGGETIELASDLGGGKTALTKGVAAGMGSNDTVQSPTFTISRIYTAAGGLELHHFDFYRLTDAGVMAAELTESLSDKHAVVVIEWSDIVEDILPKEVIRIAISTTGDTSRVFKVAVPDSNVRLLKALKEYKQ